jgi:hypothetical protein
MTAVTLIMPFDTGRSYSMPPELRWDDALTPNERSAGWAPAYQPTHIQKPLGEPVRLRIERTAALGAAEVTAGWLRPDFDLEAVFFPVGIGVLLLKGRLAVKEEARWPSFAAWESEAYARFGPVAQSVAQSFAALAERVGLLVLHQVERGGGAPEFPWIYPLFFVEPAKASIDGTDVLANRSLDGAPIAIRWRGTDVGLTASADRTEIEWFFVVASVTWQSLFIIDGLLSRLLAEFDHPSPRGRTQRTGGAHELRQVRLFCKRVVDGSRALRWTIARGGVELLDGIHTAWTTSQLWQSIDDKTSLLVLIHEQHQAEAREETGTLVGYVALLIAIVSTVSAVSDLLTLLDPQGQLIPPGWKRLVVALLLPTLFGTLTFFGLHRLQKRLHS